MGPISLPMVRLMIMPLQGVAWSMAVACSPICSPWLRRFEVSLENGLDYDYINEKGNTELANVSNHLCQEIDLRRHRSTSFNQ